MAGANNGDVSDEDMGRKAEGNAEVLSHSNSVNQGFISTKPEAVIVGTVERLNTTDSVSFISAESAVY